MMSPTMRMVAARPAPPCPRRQPTTPLHHRRFQSVRRQTRSIHRWRQPLRGRTTTIVVSGRNLGYLWSKYPGVDPESNNSVANTGGGNSELTAQPPIRYWVGRINFAF